MQGSSSFRSKLKKLVPARVEIILQHYFLILQLQIKSFSLKSCLADAPANTDLKHGPTCQLHHILTATTEKHPNTVRTHSGKKMATNRM